MIVSMTTALLALALATAPAANLAVSGPAPAPTTAHQLPTHIAHRDCVAMLPATEPPSGLAMPQKGGPDCPPDAVDLSTQRQGLDITVVVDGATDSVPMVMIPATRIPVERTR